MNYPYGESVMYTGGQPLVVNTLKVLSNFGVDSSDDLVGILNVFLLFTIVIAVALLFLLLVNMKLPWHYSIIVANIIVFLSPQLDRFGGHYNLSYLFFLPLYLYLLKKFFDKPSYKLSILIGSVNLIALCVQAYFFAMFSFWFFFILVFGYLNNKEKFGNITHSIFYLSIQLIAPYLLFSVLTLSYSDYRTTYPWGFFNCRAFPESVFLPIGKPYGSFFTFSYLKWEGMSYIGLTATICFFRLLFKYLKRKKRSLNEWLKFTGNDYLDAIFLGSMVALLVSFAYPFVWDLKWLLNYTGPFKQFRASGRFAWLFFYAMNIIVYFLIWKFYKQKSNYLSIAVLVAALSLGMYDSYLNVRGKEAGINNHVAELEDISNEHENNRWINNINTNEFQSILPLPFFHVGSEVYWIKASKEVIKNTFIASWKTGLPISSTLLSRTSIPKTMKLLEYYFEPIQQKTILEDLPNNKDFLLIHHPNETLNKDEKLYTKYAIPIAQNENYELYRLPVDSMKQMSIDYQNNVINEFSQFKILPKTLFVSDSSKAFNHLRKGDEFPNLKLDQGFGFIAKRNNIIYEDALFESTDSVLISFWMSDMDKDIIPRTHLKASIKNKDGKWKEQFSSSIFKRVKYVMDNGWGLVEFSYKPQVPNEQIRIELKNSLTTSHEILVNNILVRPTTQNVYYRTNHIFYKNNRIFTLQQ